ncbi:MAG TPA: hypothetical protein ENN29_13295 [Candidatus Hydrogenedentes bacterium]|nr:hypothetical protein [Candidatus Hydrogenedentota bacterium]
MAEGTFAGAVNCMDGRTQEPVINYLKETLGVDYVDAITEPGPIKLLAENTDPRVETIKTRCDISLRKHHAVAFAVVSHYDCAGNPVEKEEQMQQLEASIKLLRSWYPEVAIYGLWVDDAWSVTEVVADVPA